MSDFLSRLVGRTFGLTTVIQPVIGSIFTPEIPEKNDYMQALIHDNESVISQDEVHTGGSRKARTGQYNGQPAFNSSRLFREDQSISSDEVEERDNRNNFSSMSKPQEKREQKRSFKQNDSGYQEQRNSPEQANLQEEIKSLPLHRINENNQDLHRPPAELAQDEEPLYKDGSDSQGTAESEILYAEDRGKQGISKLFPELRLPDEQSYRAGQAAKRQPEPSTDNADSFTGKILLSHLSELTLLSGDPSNLKSDELILKDDEPVSKADSNPPGHPYLNIQPSPVIPGRQSLRQLSAQKANATQEQMGKMLTEPGFVASTSRSTGQTIKVTIGRVEVRASEPPVIPQPEVLPQRQYPILSLDDYLKQYNG